MTNNTNTQLPSCAKHDCNTKHTPYLKPLPISCAKFDFNSLNQNGYDGVYSLSCFFISITQFIQITNPEMSNLTPPVLRDMVGFPKKSIMFELNFKMNPDDPDAGISHGDYLQKICNIFNLDISFFGVNMTGADTSCWIGKSHVNYRDNKRPVLKENCVSIATFQAHYELIVSKTYKSNALNYRCLKDAKLRICKYIPITQVPPKQASMYVPPKQASMYVPPKQASSVCRIKSSFQKVSVIEEDNLAKYTGQCMFLREYISNCEKELLAAQNTASDTMDEYKKLSLPPGLINIHAEKSTQIISSIQSAINESRTLLHILLCQIDELNV
jgi:hypothetical protein